MKIPRASLLTLSLCLLPTALFAQDGFAGRYELSGHYTNRRATAIDLTVDTTDAGLVVTRTGRYLSRRHSNKPAFTWTSSRVQVQGRRMRVTFEVSDTQALVGMADMLTAGSSRDEIVAALSESNTFEAVYFLRSSGAKISEVVVNKTRLGDHEWWRWISTSGDRKTAPMITALSRADYERIRNETIKSTHQASIAGFYANLLADPSLSAGERLDLEQDRDLGMQFFLHDVIMGDDFFEMELEERYVYLDDPYLDAHGRKIPRQALEAVSHLSKGYLFDTRTGALVAVNDQN